MSPMMKPPLTVTVIAPSLGTRAVAGDQLELRARDEGHHQSAETITYASSC